MESVIPWLDAVAALAYIGAFQYAWRTIPSAGESRAYWIIFSFAMLLGFAHALSNSLEWMGLAPSAFDEMQPVLMAIVVVDLSLAAILSYVSLTRPFD